MNTHALFAGVPGMSAPTAPSPFRNERFDRFLAAIAQSSALAAELTWQTLPRSAARFPEMRGCA